jgi:type II secretory pathway pseudopilin PulG
VKQLLSISAAVILAGLLAASSYAQTGRASVPASEVNGTFRSYFKGKYKGSFNEIKILALGGGKLKIALDLTYPFTDGTGELSANLGQLTGIAAITGDTAVYASEEFGSCRITIKFVRLGTIRVSQDGGSECGFGHNVTADGTYTRFSKAKPKFELNP